MSKNKKPTVVIIDDDEDYLDILKMGLSNEFEIHTIGNMQRIECELKGLCPALILLDNNLGRIKPEDVIVTIRSFDDLKQVPIILMSGTDPGKRESSAPELDGFMLKPDSFQEVRNRLWATLSRHEL